MEKGLLTQKGVAIAMAGARIIPGGGLINCGGGLWPTSIKSSNTAWLTLSRA